MSRLEIAVAAVVCIGITMTWALHAGQDANWDLLNYHFWDAYAFLAGRTFYDVAPAQLQTWQNPLPYLVSYLLICHASPILATAVLAAVAGFNGLLIYLLARRLIISPSLTSAIGTAALATVVGLTGPLFLSQAGTSFFDAYGSLFVLGSLIMVFAKGRRLGSRIALRYGTAGLLLGAAVGLKLTYAVYALAMTFCLLPTLGRRNTRTVVWYGAGLAAGAAITGGYWAVRLWAEYGNPVFPFYNALFRSPFYEPANFYDTRFAPRSLSSALTYPLRWLVGDHPTTELPFRDARFAVVSVLLPVALLCYAARTVADRHRRRRESSNVPREWWSTIAFWVISYAGWMYMWSIQRYATVLELLSGVIVVLCVGIVTRRRFQLGVMATVALFLVSWTQPVDWGHVPFEGDWFGVRPSETAFAAQTVWFIGGSDPVSYVLPYLPRDHRAIRLFGNMPVGDRSAFWTRAVSIVARHEGPIRTLSAGRRLSADERLVLSRMDLELDDESCASFTTRLHTLVACALTRAKSRISR